VVRLQELPIRQPAVRPPLQPFCYGAGLRPSRETKRGVVQTLSETLGDRRLPDVMVEPTFDMRASRRLAQWSTIPPPR
jgi:hypothetical protein